MLSLDSANLVILLSSLQLKPWIRFWVSAKFINTIIIIIMNYNSYSAVCNAPEHFKGAHKTTGRRGLNLVLNDSTASNI